MRTFRARRRHWLVTVVMTVLIAALFVLAPIWAMEGLPRYIILISGPVIVAYIIWEDWRPMWRAHLSIDNDNLSARAGEYFIVIELQEIMAAKLFRGSNGQFYLLLGTSQGKLGIPLKYLDQELIWQTLQEYVSSEHLGETAYEKWLEQQEFYQVASKANARLIQHTNSPLRVKKETWLTALGWVVLLFFGGLALWSMTDSPRAAIFFTLFAAPGALWIFPDIVEIDAHSITYIIPPFGRYRIYWDQVRWIEHTPDFDWMILHGEDKKLAMIGPKLWAVSERPAVRALMEAHIQQQKIEMRTSQWASFKIFSKNTRIS